MTRASPYPPTLVPMLWDPRPTRHPGRDTGPNTAGIGHVLTPAPYSGRGGAGEGTAIYSGQPCSPFASGHTTLLLAVSSKDWITFSLCLNRICSMSSAFRLLNFCKPKENP